MNRKIIVILSIMLSAFCFINPAYSDLKNFKDSYKKEESSKKKSSSKSSLDDSCVETCIDLLPIWFEANASINYSSYPYSHEQNNFICVDSDEEYQARCFEGDGSSWYLSLESGWQYAFDNGNAGFARLSGKIFKFFGPEFEFKRLVDDNNDKLDYYAFGINIPLFQLSGFSPDLYVQKSYLRGVIDRDGISYGIIINSYPINPISLMFRFGVQSFGNIKGEDYASMDFYDYEGRLGLVFYRLEIFGGYRRISTELTKIHGPIVGIKIFI